MLQNGWALESDFLQNDPRNQAYMGLEASHFIGEFSTGIYIYIYIYTKYLAILMEKKGGTMVFIHKNRVSKQ